MKETEEKLINGKITHKDINDKEELKKIVFDLGHSQVIQLLFQGGILWEHISNRKKDTLLEKIFQFLQGKSLKKVVEEYQITVVPLAESDYENYENKKQLTKFLSNLKEILNQNSPSQIYIEPKKESINTEFNLFKEISLENISIVSTEKYIGIFKQSASEKNTYYRWLPKSGWIQVKNLELYICKNNEAVNYSSQIFSEKETCQLIQKILAETPYLTDKKFEKILQSILKAYHICHIKPFKESLKDVLKYTIEENKRKKTFLNPDSEYYGKCIFEMTEKGSLYKIDKGDIYQWIPQSKQWEEKSSLAEENKNNIAKICTEEIAQEIQNKINEKPDFSIEEFKNFIEEINNRKKNSSNCLIL